MSEVISEFSKDCLRNPLCLHQFFKGFLPLLTHDIFFHHYHAFPTESSRRQCKLGATGSLLISEPVPCFKCVCWDRGRGRRCISSQERPTSVIVAHFLPPHFLLLWFVNIWDQWILKFAQQPQLCCWPADPWQLISNPADNIFLFPVALHYTPRQKKKKMHLINTQLNSAIFCPIQLWNMISPK